MDEFPLLRRVRPGHRPLAAALALAAALSLLSAGAFAGQKAVLFQQVRINDDQTGEEDRMDPAILPLQGGGFLLFWVDASRGQTDILSRRFHSDLTPAGDPLLVNTDGVYQPQSGVVVSAGGGGVAMAVWANGAAGETQLQAQAYSTIDGSLVGTNVPLTDDQYKTPQIMPAVE